MNLDNFLKKSFNSAEIDEKWGEFSHLVDTFDIPDGTGGVNPGDRRALFYLISHFKPKSILEIGTHIGASLSHIFGASSPESQITTVDIQDVNSSLLSLWKKHKSRLSPEDLVSRISWAQSRDSNVTFVKLAAREYLAQTQAYLADFIFLDGSHTYEAVAEEFPLALAKLRTDGILVLHDYFPDLKPLWSNGKVIPGPFEAVQSWEGSALRFNVTPLGELPWPTKCGSNVTSLAIVTHA